MGRLRERLGLLFWEFGVHTVLSELIINRHRENKDRGGDNAET